MRPVSTPGRGTGSVTSSASRLSWASSPARLSTARRATSASVTWSFSALIAAPCALRWSGASLPSVASSAEIDPFLPSAATRAASSVFSSGALSMAASVSRSRAERSDILGLPAKPLAPPSHPTGRILASPKPSLAIGAGEGDKACLGGLGQRAFGLLDDRGEGCGLGNGEVGQHLTVDFNPCRGKAGNKPAIGQPVLAHRRIDALNP